MTRRWTPAILVPIVALAGSDLSGAQAPPTVPPPARPSPNICLPGTGPVGWCGDGEPATRAKLARPNDVAIASDGSLIIADTGNQVIRSVEPSGRIATIAGTGIRGGAPAVVSARRATFRDPVAVAVDPDGSVVVADQDNDAIRRIELSGRVVTVVRSGLSSPTDVVVLPTGGYAVADSGNDRVVHVSGDGKVAPIAGTGVRGYSGDGGPATAAQLDGPVAVASSSSGLLIVDSGNGVVRRVALDGTISTVVGTPPGGSPGSTPASRLVLESAQGVASAGAGFVVTNLNRVWRVSADGTIQPLAGTGVAGFNGDVGTAGALRLDHPAQLAVTPDNATLIVDRGNDRIRRVAPDGSSTLTLAGSGDPNVRLAPTPAAPFKRLRRGGGAPRPVPPRFRRRPGIQRRPGSVPRFQRRRAYRFRSAGNRPPPCSVGTTTSNELKIQPYSATSLASGARPVVIRFGITRDARSLTAYAWRKRVRYGTRTKKKQAADTSASVRLRGRLSRKRYYAVVAARTVSGERLCDARRMEVE